MEDRVAVVTGAARGIGRGCAAVLAGYGARVVVADVDAARGRETARELRERGGDVTYEELDVRIEADWTSLRDRLLDGYGSWDVLVNNAGVTVAAPLPDLSLEEWREAMRVNVEGVFLGMKHACPVMAEQGGGSVVNISSVAAMVGREAWTCYGATKGAVRTMTKDVAVEYAQDQVRVNSVHPSLVETPTSVEMAMGTPLEEIAEQMTPMGEVGQPEDIGQAVVFLASDRARLITGAELVVDGGMTAR